MKYILILILLSSCGIEVRHTGETKVKHVVEIEPFSLMNGFREYCENIQPNNVDKCIDEELGRFFRILIGETNVN